MDKKCQCKRFKTVVKRNGFRLVVACRECGKERPVAFRWALAAWSQELRDIRGIEHPTLHPA